MNENTKYFFTRIYDKFFEEDTFGNAAQVAFYFSFAIFPLLLFLISLFGIVLGSADELRVELFQYLRRIMPVSAYDLVFNTISEVMEKSSGGKITLGLLIALWSASAGLDSLRGALNEVFELKETRPIWKTRPISIGLTFAIGVLIFFALGIIFYGSPFMAWILSAINLPIPSPFILSILKWATILIVLLLAFALIYNISPARKHYRWRWITPGAITGIILWILVSNGFRIYLEYFDTYSRTYGSLGAMIILMLWLYLTALVILIGAVINQITDEIGSGGVEKAKEKAAIKAEEERLLAEAEQKQLVIFDKDSIDLERKQNRQSRKIDAESFSVNATRIENKEVSPNPTLKAPTVSEAAESLEAANQGKPLIGLTVAGVFGLMMGLLFRRKSDKP